MGDAHSLVARHFPDITGAVTRLARRRARMNQDETIALFLRGKDAWNAWAEGMLAKRKAMEADGSWAAEQDWRGDLEAENDETAAWMKEAAADFSALRLMTRALADAEAAKGGDKEDGKASLPVVKSIVVEAHIIDLGGWIFPGRAGFEGAQFHGEAGFGGAQFHGEAWFGGAQFHRRAGFGGAQFHGGAWFGQTDFKGNVRFPNARFLADADFRLVRFPLFASFAGAHFSGSANFNAIRGERAFDLTNAVFETVPDFIQAHFEEAPRLDNVIVRSLPPEPPPNLTEGEQPRFHKRWHVQLQRRSHRYRRLTMADGNITARWRALKRLAIQAHDQEREQEFFSQEIRAARFATDWPVPLGSGQRELFQFGRFWAGVFYGLGSNYGRSILLPALWWAAGVLLAASFYFGEHRALVLDAPIHRPWSEPGLGSSIFEAWHGKDKRPCFVPDQTLKTEFAGSKSHIEVLGLSDYLRDQTSASREALQLALRDGFLILYGDADTAHRTYGCLYGVELYGGGTPVAIVPPQVGFWSAMHKLYSAVMIFLFGLALRNMLKMK